MSVCAWNASYVFSTKTKLAKELATTHDIVNDDLLEERLVQMCPDYPCLYDVRRASVKLTDVRQPTKEERL